MIHIKKEVKTNTINLSQFQKGTYFVSFIDKSEKVTKTIILN